MYKNLSQVKDFTDLEIYKLAEEIVLDINKVCSEKRDVIKKWKLLDHLIECALSIGSNIAEGFGRFHYKENVKFLYYARGSLAETKSRLRYFWLVKDISDEEVSPIFQKLEVLNIKINNTISSTMNQINKSNLQNLQ